MKLYCCSDSQCKAQMVAVHDGKMLKIYTACLRDTCHIIIRLDWTLACVPFGQHLKA